MNAVWICCTLALGGIALWEMWCAVVMRRVAKNQIMAIAYAQRYIISVSPRLIPVIEARHVLQEIDSISRNGLPKRPPTA